MQQIMIVEVHGAFDGTLGQELVTAVDDQIRAGARFLIIGGETMTLLDSAGLRALVTIRGKLRSAGGNLALAALSEAARFTLESAGLISAFAVFPDRQTALQTLHDSAH
jgi:anti-anti-sigma factor